MATLIRNMEIASIQDFEGLVNGCLVIWWESLPPEWEAMLLGNYQKQSE